MGFGERDDVLDVGPLQAGEGLPGIPAEDEESGHDARPPSTPLPPPTS